MSRVLRFRWRWKWAMFSVGSLFLALFVVSGFVGVRRILPGGVYALTLGEGAVGLFWTMELLGPAWKYGGPLDGWAYDNRFVLQWWPGRRWGANFEGVEFPLWIIALPLLLSSAWLFRRDRRLARLQLCATCGYDLLGIAASAPCPECGKGRLASMN